MLRIAIPATVVLLLLGDGLLFGLLTRRWQAAEPLSAVAARLERVPLVIGDWKGDDLQSLSDRNVAQAGFIGHLHRHYENRLKSNRPSILLACGEPGPLSAHAPELCFAGGGYVQKGQSKRLTEKLADGSSVEVWSAKFYKPKDPILGTMHIYWTWHCRGMWQAPDNARWSLAGAPFVYKLYLIQEAIEKDSVAETQAREFLQAFVPALDRCLFAKRED